jgi:hypothetical protein
MSIFLQNTGLVWLAPLVGIPILLHFLARAKPPQYLFSATALIRKVVQQTIRIKRPKDRLLLICRTALFAVLLSIFLRPVMFVRDMAVNTDSPRNVVIVIDRSASMTWSEGGRSRFAAACNEAADILDSLSSMDIANVIWLDSDPDAVFPEMGANILYLRDRVRASGVTYESGNPALAIQLAVSQLNTGSGSRELCIISDFQASQWKSVTITVPEDIHVSTLWPAGDVAENGAVLSIRTEPAAPLVGEPAQVICNVGNFSGAPRSRTVTLEIDEKRVARQVQIPAWGQGTIAIEHVFSNQGRIVVSARLDEDAYGADDWRGMIVPVRNGLKVGLFGDDLHTATVWRRALHALPWVETYELNADTLSKAAQYDLLMLSGWKGGQIKILAELGSEGIPIILSPAPGLPVDKLAFLAGINDLQNKATVTLETLKPSLGMQIQDTAHKAFSLFTDGAFGDPAQAAFRKRWFMPTDKIDGNAILSFTDGKPALFEYTGVSPVLLWLAPLSPQCSDWSSQVAFLPFFGELINTVRAHKAWILPETALPGESLVFESEVHFDDVRLVDETGTKFPFTRATPRIDAPVTIRFVSDPIAKPGFYRLCAEAVCPSFRIVNFPGTESDLRVMSPPPITKGPVRMARSAAEMAAAREGTSLWKIFVWMAIALIVIESALVFLLYLEDRKLAQGAL